MVDAGFDIIQSTLRVGRFAAGTSRVAWAGFSTLARGLSVAGAVFDAVAIPVDLFIIAKGAYDIHKHKTGKGTNSNRACQLEAMIRELEEHRDCVLQIKEIFEHEQSESHLI